MTEYRVGIVNPNTPFSLRVRELLADGHIPVKELKLFSYGADEGSELTEFHDEVLVTQVLDADLLPSLDLCFFSSNDSDILNRIASEAAEKGVVSSVDSAVDLEAPLLLQGLTIKEPFQSPLFAVPRMASFLLGTIMERLKTVTRIKQSIATVLLPAVERGEEGAEELHKQVVSILNFSELPERVFRGPLAFNVKIAGYGMQSQKLAEAVSKEASRIAGLPNCLTVSLLQVPVFHAYSAAIWVGVSEMCNASVLEKVFHDAPFVLQKTQDMQGPTPVGVAGSKDIHLGAIRYSNDSTRPGFWLWMSADTPVYDSGLVGVDMAKQILENSKSKRN